MDFFRSALLAISLIACGSTSLATAYFSDRDFDQERMIITNYSLILLSPCEDEDHLTAYTDNGTLLWDVSIFPKVMSWKLKNGMLYVFSKSRQFDKTYLTCIDPATGFILWERP